MIEVILKEPVDHLGSRGDVVKVADGFARNYLLPRKLALQVTAGNQRQIDAEKKRAAEREAQDRSVAEAIASRLTQTEYGRSELGDKTAFHRIELAPKPSAPVPWGRISYQILEHGDTVLPRRAEYYRRTQDREPARMLEFGKIRSLGGRLVPSETRVTVASKPREHTRITYDQLRFDVQIPAEKFSEQALRR